MPNPKKKNAGIDAGAHVDLAGGRDATSEMVQRKFNTAADNHNSKSTSSEVQRTRVLTLLRQGPKTTIEFRQHGIMMPASRVHELKHNLGFDIKTELLALYDAAGIRHRKCARYHLIEPVDGPAQRALDPVPA